MNRKTTYISAITLLIGLPVSAADAQPAANALPAGILACAAEKDVIKRLSCFDREVAAARAPAAEPDSRRVPAEEPALLTGSAPDAHIADAPAPDNPLAAAQGPTEVAPIAVANFESVVDASATSIAGNEAAENTEETTGNIDNFGHDLPLDEITATVVELRKRPYGELVIALDNGQIWEQKHLDRRFKLDIGEVVTVKKGAISGYRLSGTNNRSIQVQRIR